MNAGNDERSRTTHAPLSASATGSSVIALIVLVVVFTWWQTVAFIDGEPALDWFVLGLRWMFPVMGLAAPVLSVVGIVLAAKALLRIRHDGRAKLREKAFALGSLLVCGFYLLCITPSIPWQVTRRTTGECIANIHQLVIALQMYVHDNDNTFPEASVWSDRLRPYIRNGKVFVCPAAPSVRSGYAYNRSLSGRRYASIEEPALTVAIFESDLGWNAAGGPGMLPKRPRHDNDDTYGFADGHVRFLLRSERGRLRF